LYKVRRKPWAEWLTDIVFDPPAWYVVVMILYVEDVDTHFLGGEAP
jgi:hypothetical protein